MYSLLSTTSISKGLLESILMRAEAYAQERVSTKTTGTMASVFFEPSTRTNLSFQMAGQKLGLTVLNFPSEYSSLNKGESLLDTLQTLDAMGTDIAVIRASEHWTTFGWEHMLDMSLVNAGSGTWEHPTQALLDAMTIQQHFGCFEDLKVTIIGDVAHSRVARSNLEVLNKLGAKVQFSGPDAFRPTDLPEVPWVPFREAVASSDVLMMLRVQFERHESRFSMGMDKQAYHESFGLTAERVAAMRPKAIFMHPGPVNRGVEIASAVMDHPRSCIQQQVRNGVAVRMAVLELCLQGGAYEQLASA